jgi:outer membrane lipoprotein-sorting protein
MTLPASDMPKNAGAKTLTAVARAGVFASVMLVSVARTGEKPVEVDVNEQLKLSDFKLGKKEKVGDSEAQVIDYTLTVKGEKEPMQCSVWVDTKTNLPLKRVLRGKEGTEKATVTETYSKFTVDGKVDPKSFELPK